MDAIQFYNTFGFRHIILRQYLHNDNTGGLKSHFVGKMFCGSGIIRNVAGEEMRLSAGDVFYLPLGLRYHSYWTPDTAGTKTVEWGSYRFDSFPDVGGKQYGMQKLQPSQQAQQYLDHIEPGHGVTLLNMGMLLAFLGESLPAMEQFCHDADKELLSKARDYIYRHNRFKVSELAKHCGMSESGLYAFFRTYAQTTPIEEKNKVLVQKATALLHSTDLSLEAIAGSLQLQSVAYLRKLLKIQTGKTASEIRKEGFTKHIV